LAGSPTRNTVIFTTSRSDRFRRFRAASMAARVEAVWARVSPKAATEFFSALGLVTEGPKPLR
jgi:hypothetical protein